MRDQYAGDISDLIKIAFLRALAGEDRTLGIGWYYAPGDDGRADGRHLEWRTEEKWRQLDEELHRELAELAERNVSALERAPIWPRHTFFHREPVPPRERSAWVTRMDSALDGADIVFLDPDNGIGSESEKHLTFEELRLLRRPGRAIVFITFPGRKKHNSLLQDLCEQLIAETGIQREDLSILRTNVSVPHSEGSPYVVQRQRWFTLVDGDAELRRRAAVFAAALNSVPQASATLS